MKKVLLILFFLVLCTLAIQSQEKSSIIVCDNGLEMLQWDLEFIQHAESSIEVLACFFGGRTACELLTAIETRLEQISELQVYVLASPVFMKEAEWQIINRLQAHYPQNFHIELHTQIVKLLPDMATIDNHVKLFIVDETYFSAGGTNLEEKHCSEGTHTPYRDKSQDDEINFILPAGMRDQDVVGRGPIARELRKAFYQFYSLWENYNDKNILEQNPDSFCDRHYFEIHHKSIVPRFETSLLLRELEEGQIKCIFGGPHQQINAITQEYVRLIEQAEKEIIIENLYFFPVQSVFQALINAVNRGVKLTIVTNGIHDRSPDGAKLFGWATRLSYVPMFYGRTFTSWQYFDVASLPTRETEIYEYYIQDMLLHKKMMLIDKRTFVVGSYNLGMKSSMGDYELILVIDSESVAEDAGKVYKKDLNYSKKISPQDAVTWYFDPVTSYLGELQKKFSGFM